MVSQSRRFLVLPFLLSLIGLLFSFWNIWGDPSALCVTEGCSLFQDFTLAGISLWWLGVVGFAALLLVSVPGFSGAGFLMAGIGVALDCILLGVMVVTAQCFNCLLIGLLLALTFLVYRRAAHEDRRERNPLNHSPLLVLWGLLFVVNIGGLCHAAMAPWVLSSRSGNTELDPADSAIHVYFSPSCVACRTLVGNSAALEGGEGKDSSVAWYPVAENSRDIWVIADMELRMSVGARLPEAMKAAMIAAPETVGAGELASPSMLLLQFRLWRNKAHVLNAGSFRLPFVEFRGLPAAFMGGKTPTAARAKPAENGGTTGTAEAPTEAFHQPKPSSVSSGNGGGELPFLSVTGFCGDGPEPCEVPPGSVSGVTSEAERVASGGNTPPVLP